VMVGPVELNTARDPGAKDTDERRLDDMLTVEEVIIVALVHGGEDAAAQGGDDDQLEKLVLKTDNFIFLVDQLFFAGLDDHLVGVGIAGGALVDAVLGKHGQLFTGSLRIGRDDHGFGTGDDGIVHNIIPLFHIFCY